MLIHIFCAHGVQSYGYAIKNDDGTVLFDDHLWTIVPFGVSGRFVMNPIGVDHPEGKTRATSHPSLPSPFITFKEA